MIGGVNGAIEDWREILIPLLLIVQKEDKMIQRRKLTAKTTSNKKSR